jgi:oxalate decarboxylase/phosphoglucose isomerase-like protein (cupin superfamily)
VAQHARRSGGIDRARSRAARRYHALHRLAGDVVSIPAACAQRIANTGAGDLVFLAVCTPRFVQEAYEEIEC